MTPAAAARRDQRSAAREVMRRPAALLARAAPSLLREQGVEILDVGGADAPRTRALAATALPRRGAAGADADRDRPGAPVPVHPQPRHGPRHRARAGPKAEPLRRRSSSCRASSSRFIRLPGRAAALRARSSRWSAASPTVLFPGFEVAGDRLLPGASATATSRSRRRPRIWSGCSRRCSSAAGAASSSGSRSMPRMPEELRAFLIDQLERGARGRVRGRRHPRPRRRRRR